ncbi:MAG: hypothetical protein OHK0053_15000 [Microscillaceae bacterium]
MVAYKQVWQVVRCLFIWGWIFLSVIACQEKPVSDIHKTSLGEEAVQSKSNETRNQAESLPLLTTQNAQKVLGQYAKTQVSNHVSLETRLGTMVIRLYDQTPLHRANFLQLVARGYYDGTVFHRVVKDMIIQGGNLDDPVIRKKKNAIGKYFVPAEFKPAQYIHKKGAIASPRHDENNPEMLSSPFEFYIVQGAPVPPAIAQALGRENGLTYSATQIQTYATLGGLPHLDNKYTVFGEVVEGLEVIDRIAALEVDKSDDWPLEDVVIQARLLPADYKPKAKLP